MKNVKAMFGAITLGLMLSSATFAGDVSTPGYVPPPPPLTPTPCSETDAVLDDISSSDLATDLLIAALSAFYQ